MLDEVLLADMVQVAVPQLHSVKQVVSSVAHSDYLLLCTPYALLDYLYVAAFLLVHQKCLDLRKAKPRRLQKLDVLQPFDLLLRIIAIAVFKHRFRLQKSYLVIIKQRSLLNTAEFCKFFGCHEKIPPVNKNIFQKSLDYNVALYPIIIITDMLWDFKCIFAKNLICGYTFRPRVIF